MLQRLLSKSRKNREILVNINDRDVIQLHIAPKDKRIIQKSDFPTFELSNRGMAITLIKMIN